MVNRFISVLCIIALVFASSVLFTTEANAASIDDFAYKIYAIDKGGNYYIYCSDTEILNKTSAVTYAYSYYFDPNLGLYVDSDITNSLYVYYTDLSASAYILHYTDFGWEVTLPVIGMNSVSGINNSSSKKVFALSSTTTSTTTGFYTYASTIPSSDFPAVDILDMESITAVLDTKLDNSLNGTTSTTKEVQIINQNITNTYNSYQAGDITYTTVQQNINTYTTELSELNELEGNTLSDLMNIQNSLTYAQTVQDAANNAELVDQLQVSSNVSAQVTGMINQANTAFSKYNTKEKNQQDTVTVLNQYITNLTNLIQSDTPTADIEAINAGINTINGIRDSVTGNSDVEHEISESAQEHDKEEKEYLEELTGETTSTIQDMSAEDQFKEQQRTEANNILALIWDNEILKRLVPISAVFMVVCVVLGIRYKL